MSSTQIDANTFKVEKHIDGVQTTITMGWDPVLHRFFFVIEKETDEEYPTYSNLDDQISETDYQNLDYFRDIARKHRVYGWIPGFNWASMRQRQLQDS